MLLCPKRIALVPIAVGFLALALAPAHPAGAKLFTIDANDNDVNEIDGSDDLAFSYYSTAQSKLVSGTFRAVDLHVNDVDLPTLQGDVDTYVDFSGFGLDFTDMDVLIFDVVLSASSGWIDEIGVGVGTDPLLLDPDGAGYFTNCTTGTELGCAHAVPGGGEIPDGPTDIFLSPGTSNIFGAFPGAALFQFDKLGLSSGNLEGGETTVRLFVAWDDTGAQTPLSKDGQTAAIMISVGTNKTFFVAIVPEPGTALLLGIGMTMLAWSRRSTS